MVEMKERRENVASVLYKEKHMLLKNEKSKKNTFIFLLYKNDPEFTILYYV